MKILKTLSLLLIPLSASAGNYAVIEGVPTIQFHSILVEGLPLGVDYGYGHGIKTNTQCASITLESFDPYQKIWEITSINKTKTYTNCGVSEGTAFLSGTLKADGITIGAELNPWYHPSCSGVLEYTNLVEGSRMYIQDSWCTPRSWLERESIVLSGNIMDLGISTDIRNVYGQWYAQIDAQNLNFGSGKGADVPLRYGEHIGAVEPRK